MSEIEGQTQGQAPEGVETLRHFLPLFAQDKKFVCQQCEFKTGNFDQIMQHFKINHLQAFVKRIVWLDDNIRLLREKYQYTPRREFLF